MAITTLKEAQQYFESFINYERINEYSYRASLKLERMQGFLKELGEPQRDLKCIHIAGTKGKGSTCAFCAYILKEAGYRVGLYTSPHLADFRERIRILEKQSLGPDSQIRNLDFEGIISEEELINQVRILKPITDKFSQNNPYGPLTFFEAYTALAFLYFKERKVDFAVLETGLGGRLDATNTANALACAITSLSHEHTKQLGNTLAEIAAEKAGIVKNKYSAVISAPQENEAKDVIRKRCYDIGAALYEVGTDIIYKKSDSGFRIKAMGHNFEQLSIDLIGQHQITNASVAVGVIAALRGKGIDISDEALRAGLARTQWPGRCELIAKDPCIILDGAQNRASAEAIKKTVKENFDYQRLILVLGVSKDKDIKGICEELYDLADEIFLTKADNPRALEPEVLAGYFQGKNSYLTQGVKEACILSRSYAHKEDLILICGSLFVVGEARQCLKQ